MKYIHAMLAVACLLVVGGAIGAARADDQDEENKGVTLYTPVNIGDFQRCMAVNVSDKPLSIIIELIDPQGQALSCDTPNTCTDKSGTRTTTNPTPEFQIGPPIRMCQRSVPCRRNLLLLRAAANAPQRPWLPRQGWLCRGS